MAKYIAIQSNLEKRTNKKGNTSIPPNNEPHIIFSLMTPFHQKMRIGSTQKVKIRA